MSAELRHGVDRRSYLSTHMQEVLLEDIHGEIRIFNLILINMT